MTHQYDVGRWMYHYLGKFASIKVIDGLEVEDEFRKQSITSVQRTNDDQGHPTDILFLSSQMSSELIPSFFKRILSTLGISALCTASSKIIVEHRCRRMLHVTENETAPSYLKFKHASFTNQALNQIKARRLLWIYERCIQASPTYWDKNVWITPHLVHSRTYGTRSIEF